MATHAPKKDHSQSSQPAKSKQAVRKKLVISGTAPEIAEAILRESVIIRASDVHFDPQEEDKIVIRFRIDGIMQDMGELSKQQYINVVNRIKVLSNLRIDEHHATQDGAMRFKFDSQGVDLRISIVPTLNGEKIAIRVLSRYLGDLTLSEIGLTKENQQIVEQVTRKPFGMILVTGPTGAGKTTTLYTVLKILNKPDVNIITIEDPAEYRIKGINQIQVNPRTNLTFARGLRSIVRQDPDVVLVGEIRDEETAKIAVNAALTGHLLLSTFHSNDAPTAITRLLHMGIEPFLLASTLEVVISQRLVRKICEKCRESYPIEPKEIEKYFGAAVAKYFNKQITLYRGKGCSSCGASGYAGRTAIYEIIDVNPELEELILTNPSSQEVWQLARKQGIKTLFEDGLTKVENGITTLQELLRVAAPPELMRKNYAGKNKSTPNQESERR